MSQNLPEPSWPLSVFFDGACPVCSREIAHYRSLDHGGRLVFIDISRQEFSAEDFGRPLQDFMARMHARDTTGRFWVGIDAFPAIWQALPGFRYRILAFLVTLPGLHRLAGLAYSLFARFRPRLPGRAHACTEDRCEIRRN